MRRTIESAPRDGKLVILEEDPAGNHGVARWSSEAGGWVGENGEPTKITPTHWYPTQGENHLQQGLDFSFFLRRAAEQRATSDDVLTPCSVAATLRLAGKPTLGREVTPKARWPPTPERMAVAGQYVPCQVLDDRHLRWQHQRPY